MSQTFSELADRLYAHAEAYDAVLKLQLALCERAIPEVDARFRGLSSLLPSMVADLRRLGELGEDDPERDAIHARFEEQRHALPECPKRTQPSDRAHELVYGMVCQATLWALYRDNEHWVDDVVGNYVEIAALLGRDEAAAVGEIEALCRTSGLPPAS